MVNFINRFIETFFITKLIFLMMLLPCFAQTNTETFSQLQFNFNNPGARAAGIGGAFISIADDATGAEANPAGLTALIQPEISAELKAVQYSRTIFNFDAVGTPDDFTYVEREFNNSVLSPSFLSFVYPLENLTLSVFRHELVNFESSFSTRQTFVREFPDDRFFPINSSLEMLVTNWGGAIGYKLNETVSIGASVGISQMKVESLLRRFQLDRSGNLRFRYTIDDNDTDYFFNLGVIFKPSEKISLGGIFKRRPQFKMPQTVELIDENDSFSNTINFKIPSSFGAGISYRPTELLTISFDVVRINYSDLTDDFVLTDAIGDVRREEFSVDDGVEIHVGGEYVTFLGNTGIVFRGGIFTEPDKSIQFTGQPNGVLLRQSNDLAFQAGDSDLHLTFGLGVILQENLQLELAGNLSRGSDELVVSFVYRFNK